MHVKVGCVVLVVVVSLLPYAEFLDEMTIGKMHSTLLFHYKCS